MEKLSLAGIVFMAAFLLLYSCKKEARICNTGTVKDVDGNVYQAIKIGSQCWLQENLKTAHYQNGNAITEIEDSATWAKNFTAGTQTAGWCYYNGDTSNNTTYGKLYNWYAVNDPRQVCPAGWHVPSDADWQTLSAYLGGDDSSGGHLKDTILWENSNAGADNSTGFSALPAGERYGTGYFNYIGSITHFWSSTASSTSDAFNRYLSSGDSVFVLSNGTNTPGFSVRCIGD